jgi:hypothetical protein
MLRRWVAWSVSVLALGTLGCRGALDGPLGFPVADQRAQWGQQVDGGRDASRLAVILVDNDRVPWCVRGDLPAFRAVLLQLSGASQPLVPGTYPILGAGLLSTGASSALGVYQSLDGGGLYSVALAVDGGVTLSACDAVRCAGTFEGVLLQLDGGSSGLSGAFDAPALGCN